MDPVLAQTPIPAPVSAPIPVSAPARSADYDVLQVSKSETRKKVIILITVIVLFVGIMMVLSYLGKPCQKSTDTTTPGILCSTSNLVDSTSQLIQGVSSHMTAIIAVSAVGIGLGFIGYMAKGYWSTRLVSVGESRSTEGAARAPENSGGKVLL